MTTSKDDCKYPTDITGGNEIITLCIGQCGVYLGSEFYSTIMKESKINQNGEFTGNINDINDRLLITRSNTHFMLTNDKTNKYIPRAIFCDLDCAPIDKMRQSFFGSLMATDNFLSSSISQASLIWAQGHYTDGAECIDEFREKIRNSIEICDFLQGFQTIHGISGGVGGGFGSLLHSKLRDDYPDKISSAYTVYPSQSFYDERNTNLVVYNTILTIHQMIENIDLCFIIDNGKVLNALKNNIGLKKCSMNDINSLLGMGLSGVTMPFRFDSEPSVNSNMRSMCRNFVSFPRMHFVSFGISPFISPKVTEYDTNINKILNELLFANDISGIKMENGKFLNISMHYRCDSKDEIAMNNMEQFLCIKQMELNKWKDFVCWTPSSIQSCYVYDGNNFCYKKYSSMFGTSICHTTAIKSIWQRISANFAKVYKRKAFLCWYKGEGMDEMEFQEADKNVRDLITEYTDKQDVVLDDDDGNDDD
eukprot:477917_1